MQINKSTGFETLHIIDITKYSPGTQIDPAKVNNVSIQEVLGYSPEVLLLQL